VSHVTEEGEGSRRHYRGLTTHLRVAGNFGSRGRVLYGFSTAISFTALPPHLAQVSLKGAAWCVEGRKKEDL